MKIFKDKECTQLLESLSLDVVAAGESKLFEFWVKNDGESYFRSLKFSTDHPEVKVHSAPESLNAGDTAKLVLEWSPSVDLKEGLSTEIIVEGEEFYAPKKVV